MRKFQNQRWLGWKKLKTKLSAIFFWKFSFLTEIYVTHQDWSLHFRLNPPKNISDIVKWFGSEEGTDYYLKHLSMQKVLMCIETPPRESNTHEKYLRHSTLMSSNSNIINHEIVLILNWFSFFLFTLLTIWPVCISILKHCSMIC